ncbi:MAG: alkaline phosphatase D family protein [Hahellaceae bacterium]|nr:alkaline phosphatase D family protein [Hahellaceae bacterium]
MAIHLTPCRVGPIVGHTTLCETRIFAGINSGDVPVSLRDIDHHYNLGWVKVWRHGDQAVRLHRFRFSRSFDYTGVVILRNLLPGTGYFYQVGFSAIETDNDNPELDWSSIEEIYSFKTAPATRLDLSFSLGSCMYPTLREFRRSDEPMIASIDKPIDKMFRWMPNMKQDTPVDFQLLVGDQVYADPWNKVLPWTQTTSLDAFYKMYRQTYQLPFFRQAMANVPTYMLMDDHEVNDGFRNGVRDYESGSWWGRYVNRNRERLNSAMQVFQVYQLSHGGAYTDILSPEADPNVGYIKGQNDYEIPQDWYYSFQWGVGDFFLTDCRTERTIDTLISRRQMTRLKEWLRYSDLPFKFIVSSIPVFPDAKSSLLEGRPDHWAHSLQQRNELLQWIDRHKITNVVILSGDVHASFACKLTTPAGVTVYQLICSGIYWPNTFKMFRWQKDQLHTDTLLESNNGESYEVSGLLADEHSPLRFYNGNGMARIDVTKEQVRFRVFNRGACKCVLSATIEAQTYNEKNLSPHGNEQALAETTF